MTEDAATELVSLSDAQEIARQVHALREQMHALAEELHARADALIDPGVPAPDEVLQARANVSERFRALMDSTPVRLLAARTAAANESLNSVQALLAALAQLEEERRQVALGRREQTLAILTAVASVVATTANPIEGLEACQKHAAGLRDRILADEPVEGSELDAIVNGTHPCSALVSLINPSDPQDFDHIDHMRELVAVTYGRALAIAAARGALASDATVQTPAPPPPSPANVRSDRVDVPPAERSEAVLDDLGQPPSADAGQDAPVAEATLHAEPVVSFSGEQRTAAADAVPASNTNEAPSPTSPAGPSIGEDAVPAGTVQTANAADNLERTVDRTTADVLGVA